MATLLSRLSDLITAIGADIKLLTTAINAKSSNLHAVLTSQQANSTVTPAVLTSHSFTIPPGKTLTLQGMLIFQSAALTTGAAYGIRVVQGASASANAIGSWNAEVLVSATAAATGLRAGGRFNVAGGANTFGEVVGTGVSALATDHAAVIEAVIKNQSTNANTIVTLEFRSEVAGSSITAQIGTSAIGVLG